MQHLKEAWAELTAPGAQFAMTDTTVLGNPMRVFASAPPHMRFVWELSAGHGDKDYLVYEDERYSYADIHAQVRSLAHALRETYGVGSGDRVAIAMRNYPEWVVAYWATVCVGAAAAGMNAWWTTAEMEYGLADSKPKVLIADRERLERAAPVIGGDIAVIAVRADTSIVPGSVAWADVVDAASAPATLPDATIDPDDDV
jgi:long-chain acyl-CoA synthetase